MDDITYRVESAPAVIRPTALRCVVKRYHGVTELFQKARWRETAVDTNETRGGVVAVLFIQCTIVLGRVVKVWSNVRLFALYGMPGGAGVSIVFLKRWPSRGSVHRDKFYCWHSIVVMDGKDV